MFTDILVAFAFLVKSWSIYLQTHQVVAIKCIHSFSCVHHTSIKWFFKKKHAIRWLAQLQYISVNWTHLWWSTFYSFLFSRFYLCFYFLYFHGEAVNVFIASSSSSQTLASKCLNQPHLVIYQAFIFCQVAITLNSVLLPKTFLNPPFLLLLWLYSALHLDPLFGEGNGMEIYVLCCIHFLLYIWDFLP